MICGAPFLFMEFQELARQFSSQIKALASRHDPRCGFVDNDDLMQEALISLWLKWKQGKLEGKNKSYIIRGCYFDVKNFLRKSLDPAITVSLDVPINEDGTTLEEIITDKNILSYNKDKEASFLIDTIRNDGLTPREKEVFECFLKGLNTREIGKKLCISHVRVVKLEKSIRKKAKRKLKYGDRQHFSFATY